VKVLCELEFLGIDKNNLRDWCLVKKPVEIGSNVLRNTENCGEVMLAVFGGGFEFATVFPRIKRIQLFFLESREFN
jgi:hypothetical protein